METYLYVVVGIVISIVLPILRALLPNPSLHFSANSTFMKETVKPYLIITTFSLVSAILICAGLPDDAMDCKAAILAGYAWDSTVQKMHGAGVVFHSRNKDEV